MTEIPHPEYEEQTVIKIWCPVDGCDWTEYGAWSDLGLGDDTEYERHYRAVHLGSPREPNQ